MDSKTVKNLITKHKSIPANPDIAKTFFRAGYIEHWGRGTVNIINNCKQAGLPAPDFDFSAGLTVLFKKENKSFEELSGINYNGMKKNAVKTTQKTTQKTAQKIINLIHRNKNITTIEMADLLNITRSAVAKQISKLKEKRIIKRIGPDKGGYWEIIDNDKV